MNCITDPTDGVSNSAASLVTQQEGVPDRLVSGEGGEVALGEGGEVALGEGDVQQGGEETAPDGGVVPGEGETSITSSSFKTEDDKTEAQKDQEFAAALCLERKRLVKTRSVYWRGRFARIVFKGVGLEKKLLGKIRYAAGRRFHCRECMNRSQHLANCLDANGQRVWLQNQKRGDEGYICRVIQSAPRPVITGVHVVTTKSVYGYPETSGQDTDGTPYQHYTKEYDQVSDLTPEEAEMCQNVMDKYIPLIFSLLNRFPNIKGMRDSTRIMIEVARQATYGIKVLSSLKWMHDVFQHIIEHYDGRSVSPQMSHLDRTRIAVYAISMANVSNDYNGWVLTEYHQVNGTLLNVFKNAASKEGIKSMLENIFNPTTYKKPTSEPSERQIEKADELIGDFDASIFSIGEDYESLEGVHTVGGKRTEKPSIWATLKEKKRVQKGSGPDDKYNCASRFSGGIENFSTVTKLIQMIKSGKIDKIRMNFKVDWRQDYTKNTNRDLSSVCFCKIMGMKPGVLKTPYLWNFERNGVYLDMDFEVSHVHICNTSTFHNVVFILKTTWGKTECTRKVFHVDFLSTQYERILRKPWEALQETAKDIVSMPEGYVAAGVGSAKGKDDGRLVDPVALTVMKGNMSKDVRITHW